MRPMDLASSLVFASLADVFRNMATGMSPVLPALLSEVEMSKTGLIRYILERVPFALPHSQLTANNDALVNHFDGGLVENASMTARISNVESLYETLSDVHIGVKCFVSTDLFKVSLSKKPLFEGGIWSKYLQPTNLDDWSNKQTEHLEEYLQIGPKYLSKIGDLISSRHPQTTLVEGYSPIPPNGLPVSWKNAVPESLRLALISRGNNGIWR